jgi:hypothetical protein
VEFFGVDVTPLGGATATIDPLGELEIANIGVSGNDGWQASSSKSAALAYKSTKGKSGSASKREINPGSGGGLSGPLLTSELSSALGALQESVFIDFSPFGSVTYSVDLMQNGALVGSASGETGPIVLAHDGAFADAPSLIDYEYNSTLGHISYGTDQIDSVLLPGGTPIAVDPLSPVYMVLRPDSPSSPLGPIDSLTNLYTGGGDATIQSITVVPVPEPATLLLASIGLSAGLLCAVRKKKAV